MVTDLIPDVKLTHRQEQILECIALGYSHKEIADHFGVSQDTISQHVKVIKEKTRAQKAAELSVVWFCRKQNLSIRELIAKRIIPVIFFIVLSSISIFSGVDAVRCARSRSGRRNESEYLLTA